MKRFIIKSICILSLFCITPALGIHAEPSIYKFAYLSLSTNNKLQLNLVNPVNLTVSGQHSIPLLPLQAPSRVLGSPDGKWLGLDLSFGWHWNLGDDVLRLINISSGTSRDIIHGYFPETADRYAGKYQDMAWSPDSKYLAFVIFENQIATAYVYNVATDSTTKLTVKSVNAWHLAWTNDSSELAVQSDTCSDGGLNCQATIEAFDMATLSPKLALDLSSLPGGGDEFVACNLRWSPDGRYLSFVSICDTQAFQAAKEVYIWDTKTTKFQHLTSFTLDILKRKPVIATGIYHTVWADSQTLLVSVIIIDTEFVKAKVQDTTQLKTFVYQIPNGTFAKLSSEDTEEWAVNPITGEIAFSSTGVLDPKRGLPDFETFTVKKASLKGQAFANLVTDSKGADLHWSPDGTTLEYSQHDAGSFVSRLVFIAKSGWSVYMPKGDAADPLYQIIPIGWVTVQ